MATVVYILIYVSATLILINALNIKIDGAYTRKLRAAKNKSWNYSEYKFIKEKDTLSADIPETEKGLISDVLLWKPTIDKRKPGQPPKTYIT